MQNKEKIITLFDNYTAIVSNAKYEAKHGKGIETLTPKQLLQRLPKTVSQGNTGNISENLLNKIRQVIYSLGWEKEITKNVYNNIMNSIKL